MLSFVAVCDAPTAPTNGNVDIEGTSIGNTATYTCNSGFERIGTETATCFPVDGGASAEFSPEPPLCLRKLICLLQRMLPLYNQHNANTTSQTLCSVLHYSRISKPFGDTVSISLS